MAIQDTRREGLAARDAYLKQAGQAALFNQRAVPVHRSPFPRSGGARRQTYASYHGGGAHQGAALTQERIRASREADLRAWAALALKERQADFQMDIQGRQAQQQEWLLNRQENRDATQELFDLKKIQEESQRRKTQDQRAAELFEQEKAANDFKLDAMEFKNERNKELKNLYGATLKPTTEKAASLKGSEGYFLRQAINAGVEKSAIYDQEEEYTPEATEFLDTLNRLGWKNSDWPDEKVFQEAMKVMGWEPTHENLLKKELKQLESANQEEMEYVEPRLLRNESDEFHERWKRIEQIRQKLQEEEKASSPFTPLSADDAGKLRAESLQRGEDDVAGAEAELLRLKKSFARKYGSERKTSIKTERAIGPGAVPGEYMEAAQREKDLESIEQAQKALKQAQITATRKKNDAFLGKEF